MGREGAPRPWQLCACLCTLPLALDTSKGNILPQAWLERRPLALCPPEAQEEWGPVPLPVPSAVSPARACPYFLPPLPAA